MGIKGLMQLIADEAPDGYKETEKKSYMGRTLAIDASMQLYQMMIMVRSSGDGGPGQMLMNEAGDITSHIIGMFARTTNMLEKGIKPVFVFDGKPPEFKSGELAKRQAAKKKAHEDVAEAETRLKDGDGDAKEAIDDINKAMKRTVRVTKEHNDDVKTLFRLMGIPIVEAPCEAEAQCAELCKSGQVWGVGTEDMDALTFKTPILLRKLTVPDSQKMKVVELHYDWIIKGLGLTDEQFVDLCILCGCDYCPSIKGIGKKTALKLIKEHGSIEKILESIDREKYAVPEALENDLDNIRGLFTDAEVTKGPMDLTAKPMNEPELIRWLVEDKQFDEKRVTNTIARIKKSKAQTSQSRMDSFFKAAPGSSSGGAGSTAASKKRKADKAKAAKGKGKKGRMGKR